MIALCRQTNTAVAYVMCIFVSFACARTEKPLPRVATSVPPQHSLVQHENPFMRPSVEAAGKSCVTVTLDAQEGVLPVTATMSNKCDHSVAVLTSPLELRVRRTGKEALVHERMSWTAYAILYVIAADLRGQVFRGDGVIRDGGLGVRRPPAYTTITAKGTISVPLLCDIDVPSGRYALTISTYEASQGNASARSDPFNCDESVEHHNRGSESVAKIYLGGDVRQVQSGMVMVQID
jgi:hypothetical protein